MDMTFATETGPGIELYLALVLAHAGEVHASSGPGSETVLTAAGIVFIILTGFRLVTHIRGHAGTLSEEGDGRLVAERDGGSEQFAGQERPPLP
jgi:hypothetical protein